MWEEKNRGICVKYISAIADGFILARFFCARVGDYIAFMSLNHHFTTWGNRGGGAQLADKPDVKSSRNE